MDKAEMIMADEIAYHRNGISGEPFHVVTFRYLMHVNKDLIPSPQMVAVVFKTPKHVAVFHLEQFKMGVISFGTNSFRGDNFEDALRKAIEAWDNKKWEATLQGKKNAKT